MTAAKDAAGKLFDAVAAGYRSTTGPQLAAHLVRDTEAFYSKYVVFPSPDFAFVLALWTAATFLWPDFDAFAYLTITSHTKRSGKTRLGELLSFAASNARNSSAITVTGLYRVIRDEMPVIIVDEAEKLSHSDASDMRAMMNVGYRRGAIVTRPSATGMIDWPVYCPKVFILIGDTHDTLRDRSIIVRLVRGSPSARFLYAIAEQEGNALRDRLADFVRDRKNAILQAYTSHARLDFLGDRDEEIWTPLFAVCAILCPERVDELTRAAADFAVEKTHDTAKFSQHAVQTQERQANELEYAERLARDVLAVMPKEGRVWTEELLDRLHAHPSGPWRLYKSDKGLAAQEMARLLKLVGVSGKYIRAKGGRAVEKNVKRGYYRDDVALAVKRLDAGTVTP